MLRNRALQIDSYLLTYLLSYLLDSVSASDVSQFVVYINFMIFLNFKAAFEIFSETNHSRDKLQVN